MYLVAASGTIGLEHREGMSRLEFSVCGLLSQVIGEGDGGGREECGSRVPYT